MRLFESPMLVTLLCGLCLLAGLDTPGAYADFTFGERVNLGPVVNSPYGDYDPYIAPDGLSLYFSSERPGGLGGEDIWVSTRATVSDPWGAPVNLGAPVNSGYNDGTPFITAEGLTLVFSSKNRPGGLGGLDIWLTTRPTKESPWGPPVNLGAPINSSGANEGNPLFSPDGCSLYFSTTNGTGNIVWGGDIYVTTRPTKDDPWGPRVKLGLMPSLSGSGNWGPSISADSLALFFYSDYGSSWPNIWLTTRTGNDANWGPPIMLGPEINTSVCEQTCSISPDGSTLYWCSGPGSDGSQWDLWQSTISPIVDFTGDGKVDTKDILKLIEHWGQKDPLCDIGPMPWGDGKVDEKDLEVLMSYWGQEVNDPTLVAYWPLDETSGTVVPDGAGTNDGTLVGNPTWQPTGGKVAGALLFDGVDDCVGTAFVLDPAAGPFSVFAWVKGGKPGQAVLSQGNAAPWLMVAPDEVLITGLMERGRKGPGSIRAAVITDGNWHRVGLSWDGSSLVLYMDDAEVARNTLSTMPRSYGGLYVGAGSTRASGTFWSGLIDDVRIYNRAVRP